MQQLFNYTKKKKQFQIERLKSHYNDSQKDIEAFLKAQKGRSAVGLKFYRISNWNHWNFIDTYLKTQQISQEYLKESTIYAIEANNWDFFIGKEVDNYAEAIPFEKAIKHLAQAFLLGWDKLALQYANLLLKMLYGKQYKGGHPAYLHPWFMLEIFCKWQKITLNYDQLNAPKDMRVYNEALANWDTQDKDLLQKMVQKLVDFHIAQSDEDEYENQTPDFPSSDYFIYPIEILFWMNIRSRLNLIDYESDNDLMRLPINDYHMQYTDVPAIDLIEKAKQKLIQDYPNIGFEI